MSAGPDQDVTTTAARPRKAWQGHDPTRLGGLWIGVIISSLVLIVLLIAIPTTGPSLQQRRAARRQARRVL